MSTRTNKQREGEEEGEWKSAEKKTAQAGVPIHLLSGGVWLHKDNAGCANKSISDLPTSHCIPTFVRLFLSVVWAASLFYKQPRRGLQNDKAAHLLTLARDTRDPLECVCELARLVCCARSTLEL